VTELELGGGEAPLLVDLYELTMLQAYWREGLEDTAVFELAFRSLPERRNFALACGLDDVLRFLEELRFERPALDRLASLGVGFTDVFLRRLEGLRFTGDVRALPEGTPVFPNEPLLQVVAPLPVAQLVESFVLNQIHHQTVVASKAARVVRAAAGRGVVDFGMRRMHGTDAALKGARACWVAGVDATSNVLAALRYGIPVSGTMAHSYVQAHESEAAALRAFSALYPETTLLVDTYDTEEGVRRVGELARELGPDFRVRAVRIDSGDLAALARSARRLLDAAGLQRVRIFASGGLDEERIDALLRGGAPIDGFGVGTHMGVSNDAPELDMAYKLVAYAGRDRLKTSPGKELLPGRKQVFRVQETGRALRDVLAREGEDAPGRPLLELVMRAGERTGAGRATLAEARARAADELAQLPEAVRGLAPARPPYPVEISPALMEEARKVRERVRGGS
jgi:nicotinate phosphoribosyltransferase